MSKSSIIFTRSGDSALFCRFSDTISWNGSMNIIALHKLISSKKNLWLVESVPSYTGIMLYFNPLTISVTALKEEINTLWTKALSASSSYKYTLVNIPVCYDKKYAPDMDIVSERAGLSHNDVIKLHSSAEYLVNMIGFTPGFPYLGGMDARLSTERKKEPRLKIRAGSVGIAGDQTGIYPLESPGGWQIIGRTPLAIYRPGQAEPFLLRAGHIVKFQPVSLDRYFEIGEAVRLGTYVPEIIKDYERTQDN